MSATCPDCGRADVPTHTSGPGTTRYYGGHFNPQTGAPCASSGKPVRP